MEVETDDPEQPFVTICVPVETVDEVQSDEPQPLQQSETVIVGQSDSPVLPPVQQVKTMVADQTEQLVPTVVVQQPQHEVVVQSSCSLSGTDIGPDRAIAKSVFMDICGSIKAMTARSRKRKAEKATILTSSPYTNMLEEMNKAKPKVAASQEVGLDRPTP